MIVDATDVGFIENSWIGHKITIGGAVRLHVALPDPRCVMTTLAQDDLPKDIDILLNSHSAQQDSSWRCGSISLPRGLRSG